MIIRLQTSLGHDLPNWQDSEVTIPDQNQAAEYPGLFPEAQFFLDSLSAVYNCFGLTFASRRTKLDEKHIEMILHDDRYEAVPIAETRPGDLILYRKDGEVTHAGFVVKVTMGLPWIWSKWGNGPEAIHRYFDVKSDVYGIDHKFYRCKL